MVIYVWFCHKIGPLFGHKSLELENALSDATEVGLMQNHVLQQIHFFHSFALLVVAVSTEFCSILLLIFIIWISK